MCWLAKAQHFVVRTPVNISRQQRESESLLHALHICYKLHCESKKPDPCNFVAQHHKHCFNGNIFFCTRNA